MTEGIRTGQSALDTLFAPKTVAVIGATERAGSIGRTLLWNLIGHPFGGTLYPVNPRREQVLGMAAYPAVAAVPAPVDLAIVATPAPTVPQIVGECVDAGVRAVIVISAGFREIGPAGAALEQVVRERLAGSATRLIGPNSLGVMRPRSGLNATVSSAAVRAGSVGFISQSGALGAAVLDWSVREHVGFSAFVSVGSMLDVGWGDLIDYLGDDVQTQSIVIYMESIGDARAFLSAAREVALSKPIIVLKGGRSEAAAQAAASHTGALSGRDDALDAAFRRSGVLRVNTVAELFNMAAVLAKQPRPRGPRLTILTNAGGPGVLATDALIAAGGELARLSGETLAALDRLLPAPWSHGNPIDILGDADPDRYAGAAALAALDPNSDGLLVILTPQAMTDAIQIAERIAGLARPRGQPLLASWMGGDAVAEGEAILSRANIPIFPYPDTAARAFHSMWRYTYNLRGLYETPMLPVETSTAAVGRGRAEQIVAAARGSGRTLLSEAESKELLGGYGIPVVETRVATSVEEAVAHARAIGYPVALKLHSTTIAHKSAAGGVQLNLIGAAVVRRAYRTIEAAAGGEHFLGVSVQPMVAGPGYELILGSSVDPDIGPMLLFGAGGRLVEIAGDHTLAVPPLTTTLARRMIERTRIARVLTADRSLDLGALERLLVQFSRLVVEQRAVKEIDVNPLFIGPGRLLALDARAILHAPDVAEEGLPRLAIRPYPAQYIAPWAMKDGTPVTIRPIRPEDEPLMVEFHKSLSDQSVYTRYFYPMQLSQRIAHERLTRICFIDYDREMALVVDRQGPADGAHRILAVGRLVKLRGVPEAEFAVLVSDAFQGQGLGVELLRRLIAIGRAERLQRISGDILPENRAMQRVCEKLGFRLRRSFDAPVKAIIDL